MLAILVPSRKRPHEFLRMVRSVEATAMTHVKFYLCISPEDVKDYSFIGDLPQANDIVTLIAPDNMPTAHKWNMLAEAALKQENLKLFMLGADDMVFTTPFWDDAIIKLYDKKPHVYALQDSRDVDGTPHPIMTREWIQTLGYFVPPLFMHWFIDAWTVRNAQDNFCFTHLRDYELVHIKPSDSGQGDETHSRIREWGWHERDKWVADKMFAAYTAEFHRMKNALMELK